jgi:hypothetical protein
MSGEILAPTRGAFPGGSFDEILTKGGAVFPEGLTDLGVCEFPTLFTLNQK